MSSCTDKELREIYECSAYVLSATTHNTGFNDTITFEDFIYDLVGGYQRPPMKIFGKQETFVDREKLWNTRHFLSLKSNGSVLFFKDFGINEKSTIGQLKTVLDEKLKEMDDASCATSLSE